MSRCGTSEWCCRWANGTSWRRGCATLASNSSLNRTSVSRRGRRAGHDVLPRPLRQRPRIQGLRRSVTALRQMIARDRANLDARSRRFGEPGASTLRTAGCAAADPGLATRRRGCPHRESARGLAAVHTSITRSTRAMKIFISYSSRYRELVERLRLALLAEGHEPFVDRAELEPGETFDAELREAIEGCDLFIFLLSPESVSPGGYALAELALAQSRWRHPRGRVLPVKLAPTPIESVPPYLRAVTILEPQGDPVPGVVAAAGRLGPRPRKTPVDPAWSHTARSRRRRRMAVARATARCRSAAAVDRGGTRSMHRWRLCGRLEGTRRAGASAGAIRGRAGPRRLRDGVVARYPDPL